MTFKQALELGAHVRKGETGSLVVYADRITRTETDEKGEDAEREIPFMKGYTVFNVEQIDGLPAHYTAGPPRPSSTPCRASPPPSISSPPPRTTIRHGGNQAYYAVEPDHVQMPPFESFRDAESYYATAAA